MRARRRQERTAPPPVRYRLRVCQQMTPATQRSFQYARRAGLLIQNEKSEEAAGRSVENIKLAVAFNQVRQQINDGFCLGQ